jgi:N-acetylmuramoyl-L-alanine amidase CwlA
MTILVTNSKTGYSSTTILYNKKRFKISCENGNCYSHVRVEMYTPTGLAQIANEHDIQGYQYMSYCAENKQRIKAQEDNIRIAIEYIKLIF